MSDLAPITNIAEICHQLGVDSAVLSPGSRNAPLLVAFARHAGITSHVVVDERSAGFVAMGMAQQQQRPVALVCTSGTAPLNYAPAIAEAFYQALPLLVITADRAPEWVDQQDGQTIVQPQMYQQRVKASYNLPVDRDHPDAVWQIERTVAQAIHLAMCAPCGPVHINVPLREPFYPQGEIRYSPGKVIRELQGERVLSEAQWSALVERWSAHEKILVVVGQQRLSPALIAQFEQLDAVVVGDIVSNLHPCAGSIRCADLILGDLDHARLAQLRPDLLITLGQSLVSKNLKLFLRANPATEQWHIQAAGPVADTYQSLTQVVRLTPEGFFSQLAQRLPPGRPLAYRAQWQEWAERAHAFHAEFFSQPLAFNEFDAIRQVLAALPDDAILHLGNSMAVRYANHLALAPSRIEVYSNRGTAGIEGSLSTAVGHAHASTRLNLILLGDLSFFYDRNALWAQGGLPDNLRIVLLNNQGGGIFDILPNSRRLPECSPYFTTPHVLNAANTASDFGLEYWVCREGEPLARRVAGLLQPGAARLLEIHTAMSTNSEVFRLFKQQWSDLCHNRTHGRA